MNKLKWVAWLLVLVPAVAWGLSFTKNEVRVDELRVCIQRTQGDPAFILFFKTFDTDGSLVREFAGRDVWNQLNATQKNQLRDIMNAVADEIYSQEAIPTPSPVPTP